MFYFETPIYYVWVLKLLLVKDWVRAYKKSPTTAFPGNGRKRARQDEVEALKKELDLLRKERDILKKSQGSDCHSKENSNFIL